MTIVSIMSMQIQPSKAGIGLRFAHYDAVCETMPEVGFLEVHSENFFGGGYHLNVLDELAEHYPLSLHCVGLSLGSSEPVDVSHLKQIVQLAQRYQPALISDHASWSRSGNAHLPDLLPLPYTNETLQALCDNVMRVQDALGRQLLVENPSTYLTFAESTMGEAEFLRRMAEQTDCGLLLDLNNIYVQAHNNGLDAHAYLQELSDCSIGEMHLAGHVMQTIEGETLLIDTHSQPVKNEVWALYERALAAFGPVPTLIEWDKELPELAVLLDEAGKANALLASTAIREVRHAALG